MDNNKMTICQDHFLLGPSDNALRLSSGLWSMRTAGLMDESTRLDLYVVMPCWSMERHICFPGVIACSPSTVQGHKVLWLNFGSDSLFFTLTVSLCYAM